MNERRPRAMAGGGMMAVAAVLGMTRAGAAQGEAGRGVGGLNE